MQYVCHVTYKQRYNFYDVKNVKWLRRSKLSKHDCFSNFLNNRINVYSYVNLVLWSKSIMYLHCTFSTLANKFPNKHAQTFKSRISGKIILLNLDLDIQCEPTISTRKTTMFIFCVLILVSRLCQMRKWQTTAAKQWERIAEFANTVTFFNNTWNG